MVVWIYLSQNESLDLVTIINTIYRILFENSSRFYDKFCAYAHTIVVLQQHFPLCVSLKFLDDWKILIKTFSSHLSSLAILFKCIWEWSSLFWEVVLIAIVLWIVMDIWYMLKIIKTKTFFVWISNASNGSYILLFCQFCHTWSFIHEVHYISKGSRK